MNSNFMTNWVRDNLTKQSIIVEAGMYDGIDTCIFADIATEGKVYGFEPVPECFALCKQLIGDRSNVEITEAALADKTGTSNIHISDRFGKHWASASLLAPKKHLDAYTDITFKTQIEIPTINLDEWYNEKQIGIIDLLWLDTQGFEYYILKNAPRALSNTRYLYTEVAYVETYADCKLYNEYREFLEKSGFVVINEEKEMYEGNMLLKNINLN
jgi:FkbM family methyltransferase